MAIYRKRPVEIEARFYDGTEDSAVAICDWIDETSGEFTPAASHGGELVIRTLEGDMRVSPSDYVIRGVKGEFYPCRGDIFDATYELVRN